MKVWESGGHSNSKKNEENIPTDFFMAKDAKMFIFCLFIEVVWEQDNKIARI